MSAKLSLYHYETCGYCARVRAAIKDLGIEVEYRDIRKSEEHRAALIQARGRKTVPVLRIDEAGQTRWMPESSDIIEHLYARDGRSIPLKIMLRPLLSVLPIVALVAAAMTTGPIQITLFVIAATLLGLRFVV